ncbi:hypothetical protein RDABS01_036642 [Bienertia sinuspersici]
MESPPRTLTFSPPPPHSLSSATTTAMYHRSSASPEFEFSNIGCGTQTPLHSADELFSDGFLLPLHPLYRFTEPETGPEPDPGLTEPGSGSEPEPSALITSSASSNSILSASKRWREMFKRGEKKNNNNSGLEKEKTDTNTNTNALKNNNNKSSCSSGNRNSSAELNINIWPFSRSRSAGNNSSRSKPAVQNNRKVSSAPCSRSNSSGESKSRKSWPNSPGRNGVHLGRSSPVWQVRKSGPANRTAHGTGSVKGRVLKLNVPVCMGYRQSLSCQSEEGGVESGPSSGGGSGSNGNMFSLRGLFSKKSTVLTV